MATDRGERSKSLITPWRVVTIIGALFGAMSIVGLARGLFDLGLVSVVRTIHVFYENALQSLVGWWLGPMLSEIAREYGLRLNPQWKHLLVLAGISLSVGVRTAAALPAIFPKLLEGRTSVWVLLTVIGALLSALISAAFGILLLSTIATGNQSVEAQPLLMFSLMVVLVSLLSGMIYLLNWLMEREALQPAVLNLLAAGASGVPTLLGAALFVILNAGLAYLGAN